MNLIEIDVQVENHGTIYLFRLLTTSAENWVDDNVSDDAQYFGGALAVEHRFAHDLAQGMIEDGLVVK